MKTITGMSKIATLKTPKGQIIKIVIREKLGGHTAPYIVAEQADGKTIHIQIKNLKINDDDGVSIYNKKYVIRWMSAYQTELLDSWKEARKGKAVAVPGILPKSTTTSSFKVMRIKELRTNKNLLMAIRFESGEIRVVDFKDIIPLNTAFEPLKKPSVFMQAEAQRSAVRWENIDVDIEAADLYNVSHPVDLASLKM